MAGLILLLRPWGKVKLLLRTLPEFFFKLQQIYVRIMGRNFQTVARTLLPAVLSFLIPARGHTQFPMDSWSPYPQGGPCRD